MYIKRKLERTISRYIDSREIIAVVGPRQAGKTTLIQHILLSKKKCVTVTFDDKDVLDLFERHIKEFITAYVKGNDTLFKGLDISIGHGKYVGGLLIRTLMSSSFLFSFLSFLIS